MRLRRRARLSVEETATMEKIASSRTALTVRELAAILNFSGRTIYDWVKQGRIPAMRFGSSLRFDPKVTAEWLRER